MIYREATIDDIEAIADLWEAMVIEMRPGWSPDKELWADMAKALVSMDGLSYTIIVSETEDNEIVGFVDGMIFQEPSTGKRHGVGQHFYVVPFYRKSHVGAKLYESIISEALRNDAEILEFFCFPEDLEFWGKRGFKQVRCLVRREIDV